MDVSTHVLLWVCMSRDVCMSRCRTRNVYACYTFVSMKPNGFLHVAPPPPPPPKAKRPVEALEPAPWGKNLRRDAGFFQAWP